MNIRKIYNTILLGTLVALASSCADDNLGERFVDDGNPYARVKFVIDVENGQRSRTTDGVLGDSDYTDALTNPRIGDGTRATTLIYELYDVDGNPVEVPDPNNPSQGIQQVRIENIQFPYTDLMITVPKHIQYTIVFWAQSENGDLYYDTSELKNIMVRYDNNGIGESVGQLNNTDARDVFCVSETRTFDLTNEDIHITLRRAVAQINIGFSKNAWKHLEENRVNVRKSSVSIANVGRRFNLYKNCVDLSDETGNHTQAFTIADYEENWIPAYMRFDDSDEVYPQTLTVGDEEYVWASMCYILSPGEINERGEEQGAIVDITDIKFYDEDGNDYGLPFSERPAVPVKRNCRTNILLDEYFNVKLVVDASISAASTTDFINMNGYNVDGEIAPGLGYKVSQTPSIWNGIGNGLEFYVSSVRGLKWLADRTNYKPLEYSDIPTWVNSKGETVTYQQFSKNGTPDLDTYINAIADLIRGRALISGGANDSKFKIDNQPWSYDECIITLTCDLDFSTDPETQATWIGFNCNIGRDKNYQDPATNKKTGETGPNVANGFKGTFDGNGYTIYNMVINTVGCNDPSTGRQGDKKLNNAGLFANVLRYATIKNLRLYNADITGDWNVGGFVGYFEQDREEKPGAQLLIENCQFVNSRVRSVEGNSPSDDSNVGALGGSINRGGYALFKDCSIINSQILSDYIGGMITGIPGSQNKYHNCIVQDVDLVLNEMNGIGTVLDVNIPPVRSEKPLHRLVFGNNAGDGIAAVNLDITTIRCRLNLFNGYKMQTIGSNTVPKCAYPANMGNSYNISELNLYWFPKFVAKYAHLVTLTSHIKGQNNTIKNFWKNESGVYQDANYGVWIDATQSLADMGYSDYRRDDDFDFIFKGYTDGNESTVDPLFTLSVEKIMATDFVMGAFIFGEKRVKIEDLVLHGVPSIDYGLCLYKVSDITVKDMAIYDVGYTMYDYDTNPGAKMLIENCDLRGKTMIGSQSMNDARNSKYSEVNIVNSVFNIGSGEISNKEGILFLGTDATIEQCIFRTDYKINIAPNATVTIKRCQAGAPAFQTALTPDNIDEYLHPDSKGNVVFI